VDGAEAWVRFGEFGAGTAAPASRGSGWPDLRWHLRRDADGQWRVVVDDEVLRDVRTGFRGPLSPAIVHTDPVVRAYVQAHPRAAFPVASAGG
jgi:hypothetical protein